MDQKTKKLWRRTPERCKCLNGRRGLGNVLKPTCDQVSLPTASRIEATEMVLSALYGDYVSKDDWGSNQRIGYESSQKNSGYKVKGATKSAISFLCRTAPDPFQYSKWIV